jgi:hypothetical protein
MKFGLLLILLIPLSCIGQYITDIRYEPAFPIEGDTLTIYCHVTYGSSGCHLESKEYEFISNDSVELRAFHCQGFATALCPTTDTFHIVIPVGVTGDVIFYYLPGFVTDDVQCTFPILGNGDTIPYPSSIDSVLITVYPSGSLGLEVGVTKVINIYPNPSSEIINYQIESYHIDQIRIVDLWGREMFRLNEVGDKGTINIDQLQNGLYQLLFYKKEQIRFNKRIIKN